MDHSGKLNIDDVTMLIDYLLGGNEDGCCSTCADLDGNGIVNIDDVTGLIDKLLSGN